MKYFLLFLFVGGVVAVLFSFQKQNLVLHTTPLETLPPHEHEQRPDSTVHNHGVFVQSALYTVAEDTWVTGFEVAMENAPHLTLHHFSLYSDGEPNPDCPAEDRMFASFGSETPTRIELPSPYGLFLPKGTRLYLDAMLHNPLPPLGPGGTYENVSLRLSLIKGERSVPLTYRHLSLTDSHNCVTHRPHDEFTVPPHTQGFVRVSNTNLPEPNEEHVVFEQSGVIVGIGAHLHPWEGGKKVEAFLNGKRIASFIPVKIGKNLWEWKTPYMKNLGVRVSAGDELTLSATYDNLTDTPREGAMGMLGLFVAEEQVP